MCLVIIIFFLCYYSFPLRIAQAVANSNEVSMQCQCKVCCKVIPSLIMDEGGETAGGGRFPSQTRTRAGRPPPHVLISLPGEEPPVPSCFCLLLFCHFPAFFRSVLELRAININDTFFVTIQAAGSQILSLPCLVTLSNNQSTGNTVPGVEMSNPSSQQPLS